MNWLTRFEKKVAAVERVALYLLLGTMVTLAFLQAFLRDVFGTGRPWMDELVRQLVIWVGFVGGALVTREGEHLAIDAFSKLLPRASRRTVALLIDLFAIVVCLMLMDTSVRFIQEEIKAGSGEILGIPSWGFLVILPVCFALIAFHYFVKIFKPRQQEPGTAA